MTTNVREAIKNGIAGLDQHREHVRQRLNADPPAFLRAAVPSPVRLGAAAPRKTVLLVDDEAAIRDLVAQVLQRSGYRVLVAADGEEGLRLAFEHKEEHIDLVISDVVMPGLGGLRMVAELLRRRPSLRVLFMSGCVDDAALRSQLENGDLPFVSKPFTPVALLQKVREALHAPVERAV